MIHGYNSQQSASDTVPATNCSAYWGQFKRAFPGWSAPVRTIGYYARDTACDGYLSIRASRNTDIWTIAASLANYIYTTYSRNGVAVDLIGHSMGGLVMRAAISGTEQKRAGFPPYIYVEDAVTIATPHGGITRLAAICGLGGTTTQCRQMVWTGATTSFLYQLPQNPQSAMRTDWTRIGFDDDDIVSTPRATVEPVGKGFVGHYIRYKAGVPLEHNQQLNTPTRSSYPIYWWNYQDLPRIPTWQNSNTWYYSTAGQSVPLIARNAAFYQNQR